jgi:hydrogenase-4 component F
MITALILVPILAGGIAFLWPNDLGRRVVLVVGAAAHTLLVGAAWIVRPNPEWGGRLAIDPTGLLFLSITSVLFLFAAVYCVGYLARERRAGHVDFVDHLYFSNEPEAVFTGCMLMFLASMTLVTLSQHFGLMWVGVEATTLASAPLIYFHRHHRSLEATWKYLLICSVGIALALLGNFLLAAAAADGVVEYVDENGLIMTDQLAVGEDTQGEDTIEPAAAAALAVQEEQPDAPTSMLLQDLLHTKGIRIKWLQVAFMFFLVGYGTKMGLAPLHTWLPDAHSESPSVVSALLSGALLNCAFLGILRVHQICVAAGVAEFSQNLLLIFGLLSMAVSAAFILGQTDFKRMLAYSSVEHMGIMSIGIGLGGVGAFGAALHAINHSLTKATLFLVAGNILAVYGTKTAREIHGVLRAVPLSGIMWVAGFLAITGAPPFGPFLSEFTVLKAALDAERPWIAFGYLALLALVFIGMANIVMSMAQGVSNANPRRLEKREDWLAVLPPAALGVLVLVMGIYIPPQLSTVLHDVARAMGGN